MVIGNWQISVGNALWKPVLAETALFAMVCVVDMVFTIVLVIMGVAKEANPFLATLMQIGFWAFTAVKTASFLVPLAIIEVIRPLQPRFIERALQVGLAGYLAFYVFGVCSINRAFLPFMS
jgi:hypothetical protein